ncbi:hypothetical protein DTO166G4_7451 [Paecilomyces variotii]|nr:hypothetical protein DTO166G4_7451 [Paecilomyces variotii]KAJ9242357.1 hypothetical protein DTO166G5_760 [Paecilomyces variotii]
MEHVLSDFLSWDDQGLHNRRHYRFGNSWTAGLGNHTVAALRILQSRSACLETTQSKLLRPNKVSKYKVLVMVLLVGD